MYGLVATFYRQHFVYVCHQDKMLPRRNVIYYKCYYRRDCTIGKLFSMIRVKLSMMDHVLRKVINYIRTILN